MPAGWNSVKSAAGLYGFVTGLVGIAVLANYQPAPLTFGLLLIGSIASTLLTWAMRRRVPFPTYVAVHCDHLAGAVCGSSFGVAGCRSGRTG
ncbi:MAG: hypothetical protein U0872_16360 [Planctomycetaceae bacterium]